jgi:hypothetical protein
MVDCQSQIEDALSRLNDSVVAMEVGTGEKVLTKSKISAVFSPDNLGRRSGSQSCLVLSLSPSLMALPWPPRLVLSLSLRLSWLCHGRLVREREAETRSLSLCFFFFFFRTFQSIYLDIMSIWVLF